MLESYLHILLVIIYASLYGGTQKIADLMNEHGLNLFKGGNILFGILWGIFGALLIIDNFILANIILAMNLGYLVRGRLDYLNHQIGASLIIITFLLVSEVVPIILIIFYIVFTIFGSIKDHLTDTLKRKKSYYFWLNYYIIPTFLYSLISGIWIVFIVFLFHTLSYETVRKIRKNKGYK